MFLVFKKNKHKNNNGSKICLQIISSILIKNVYISEVFSKKTLRSLCEERL